MERAERPEPTDLFALWFTAWTTQRLSRRAPQYFLWISKLWDSRSRRLKGFILTGRENRLPGSVLRKIPPRPDVRFPIAIALYLRFASFDFRVSPRSRSCPIDRIDRGKNRGTVRFPVFNVIYSCYAATWLVGSFAATIVEYTSRGNIEVNE